MYKLDKVVGQKLFTILKGIKGSFKIMWLLNERQVHRFSNCLYSVTVNLRKHFDS